MLEVVEENEERPAAEEAGEVVRRPDRLRELRGEELGIGEPRERHPEDAVGERPDELGRDLERESGLAGAAGPGDRHEARPVREHGDELLELALAPDERHRDDREIGGVERPERRKLPVSELEEALVSDQVLEPVPAEIANRRVRVEQPLRGLGEDDLPAVGGGGDPRGAVDVDADVALLRDDRLAGVQAHADADLAGLERLPRLRRRGDRLRGARERDEERIALRVDFDARVPRERLAQEAAVLGEEVGVRGPVLVEQPRRSLDVGEEKRDRSRRQLPPAHGPIIAHVRNPCYRAGTVGNPADR